MSDDDKLDRAYALGSTDDVKALYEGWAATYDTDFAQASGFRLPGLVAEAFLAIGGTGPVLDAGCGTGLVADALPGGTVIDGVDISPDMIARARAKGRYRSLIEADLTGRLPMADGAYQGLLSSGTFTHGHVGPEALLELLRVLAPGGRAAIATNALFLAKTGFRARLAAHEAEGALTGLCLVEEAIYADPDGAPEGHGTDTAFIVTFVRT